jgi:hypothetical protein
LSAPAIDGKHLRGTGGGPLDLYGVVVTGDAAHTQHDTAEYIAGTREADYS